MSWFEYSVVLTTTQSLTHQPQYNLPYMQQSKPTIAPAQTPPTLQARLLVTPFSRSFVFLFFFLLLCQQSNNSA